jgi:hypothetical protein
MRRLSTTFWLATALLALGVACGVDTSGTKSDEAPVSNAGAVDAAPPTPGDDAAPEASPPSSPLVDAGPDAPADASADAANPCDQDGDGWYSVACGGRDCCDSDPDAYPNQRNYFAGATACGGWDYDCNGEENLEYGLVACQRSFSSCSGDGFMITTPGCGLQGDFVRCIAEGFSCRTADSKGLQRCR